MDRAAWRLPDSRLMSRRAKAQRFLKPHRKPRREPERFTVKSDGRFNLSLDGPRDVAISRADARRARARELASSVAVVGPLEPVEPVRDGRGVIVWRSWLEQVLALLHEIGDE